MSEVIRYSAPRRRDEDTAALGLLILLGSWSMLFAAVCFADGLFRLGSRGVTTLRLPLGLPALAELVLLAGAAAMQLGASRIAHGKPLELSAVLIVALLLGLFFSGLSVALWRELWVAGARVQSPAGAMRYLLTGMQALSVGIAVAATGTLLVRSVDGTYSAARYLPVRLWAIYWNFVAVMGAVVLVLVFGI